ncbi:ribbon-helix-helix protein, CopG family [Butyrivibrio proteoclasticus]|uniref:ribbon-helix-helix protein, CopG family n=1 Tax=Butyrivibrio proteoclasticus TaxID=43305 RepID=UPI0005502BB6|nr:ribbon-helix-helix protein, CopG family [Butyrivibrio proteoclasticus]
MAEKKFNKQEYDNKYIKENIDRLNFIMEKGTKDRINQAAKALNISASEFVRQAIEEKISRLNENG